jgi:hypothetical protein
MDQFLRYPAKILPAPNNRLFIADSGHNRILEVLLDEHFETGQVIKQIGSGTAGFSDGNFETAEFDSPHGMALSGQTLYVTDTENHAIRAVDLKHEYVRTIAGTGEKAHGQFALGDPLQVPLRSPWDLQWIENTLFIAMAGSHQIWVLLDETQIGPFAGSGREALVDGPLNQAGFNQPSGLAFGMGHLFVADPEASAIRAIPLVENAKTITLIGQGLFVFGDQDGDGQNALLQHPTGLSFQDELLYIADSYNHKIKQLNPNDGSVETLIGTGMSGEMNGSFAQSTFYEPEDVKVLGQYLFIADTNNHQIRVANLDTLQVHNLDILSEHAAAHRTEKAAAVLGTFKVKPGQVRIDLQPDFQEGFKRNPDANSEMIVTTPTETIVNTIFPEQPLSLEIDINENQLIQLEVNLIYCESLRETLCYLYTQMFELRIETDPTQSNSIQVHFPVQPGK